MLLLNRHCEFGGSVMCLQKVDEKYVCVCVCVCVSVWVCVRAK